MSLTPCWPPPMGSPGRQWGRGGWRHRSSRAARPSRACVPSTASPPWSPSAAGTPSSTLLFDTGASPDALAVNAERLGIDLGGLQGVVLSHGHFDHAGGFDGLARLRGRSGLPLTLHPAVWTRRRLALPGDRELEMPTLSRGALEREGFEVIERQQPSLLARRHPDHRRGGPRHRVRARHAAAAPGLGRARLAARPRRHRRSGARDQCARPGAGRHHRVRPRRGGQHHPARHAADRGEPAARRHRRLPPQRPRVRARHRSRPWPRSPSSPPS